MFVYYIPSVIVYCLFFTVYCLQFIVQSSVVCCSLFIIYCLLCGVLGLPACIHPVVYSLSSNIVELMILRLYLLVYCVIGCLLDDFQCIETLLHILYHINSAFY